MVINSRKNLSGFSLIEALLAGSLLALVVFTLSSVMIFGQESSRISGDRQRATSLAEEGLEAVRNMSEASFSSLTTGPHGLVISSNKWQFSGTQDNPEIFARTINIADINAYTKSVTSTVTWAASPQRTGSVSLNSRFTNWRRAGVSNWASTTVESGYGTTTDNTQNGVVVKVDGNYAYVALLSGTNNFLIFDISVPATPVLVGKTTVVGAGSVSDIEVLGNYVYIASTSDTAEMSVINVTNKSAPVAAVAASFDAPGTNNGLSIDVLGTKAYLGRAYSATTGQGELYVIDISNPDVIPASTVNPTWSYNFASSVAVNDIEVSSDLYAYLATNSDTAELTVLDVLFPGSITSKSTYNITGTTTGLDALAIKIFDSDSDNIEDRAIIARTTEGRIWPMNISSPGTPTSILGATGFTVTGVGAVAINELDLFNSNKYLALATSAATAEVAIVDITTLATPAVLGITNIIGATNFAAKGVAYAAGVDRLLTVGVRPAVSPYYVLEIIKPN